MFGGADYTSACKVHITLTVAVVPFAGVRFPILQSFVLGSGKLTSLAQSSHIVLVDSKLP